MKVPKKLRVERLDKGYRDIRDNRGNRVSAPPKPSFDLWSSSEEK
jgi:hypothetical protein